MTLQVGTEIGGYRIEALINSGGMGAVYRATQLSVDREVALKTLLPEKTSPRIIERFKQEARVLARISHPNVLQVLDLCENQNIFFIVMEFISGVDLAQHLRRFGPLDESVALNYLKQCSAALAAVHDLGIFHRDIKPSNLMLTREGILKLTDFGIAKSVLEDTSLTRAGVLLGTPDYMPPEQIQGEQTDARSDLYALGASFYHLISGQLPFEGKNFTDVLVAHKSQDVKPLREVAQVSLGTSDLILSCMAKKPEDRLQSMRELNDLCDRLILGQTDHMQELDLYNQQDHLHDLALIEYLARSRKMNRHSLEEALETQRQESRQQKRLGIEEILLNKGYLKKEEVLFITQDLQHLRRVHENRLLVEFLCHDKLIEEDHLQDLESRVEDHGVVLLNLLKKKQWVSNDYLKKLAKLIHFHRQKSFAYTLGQLAVEGHLITNDQLETLLHKSPEKPLGARLVEEGYLKSDELNALLDAQKIRAVDHFFSTEIIGPQLRLRDQLACPHCGYEVFADDFQCRRCKKSISEPLKVEEVEVIEDLETIEPSPEEKGSWYLRTRQGPKGPLTFQSLRDWAISGKLLATHQLSFNAQDTWQPVSKIRGLAYLLGLCYSCGNFRNQEPGPCETCRALES